MQNTRFALPPPNPRAHELEGAEALKRRDAGSSSPRPDTRRGRALATRENKAPGKHGVDGSARLRGRARNLALGHLGFARLSCSPPIKATRRAATQLPHR